MWLVNSLFRNVGINVHFIMGEWTPINVLVFKGNGAKMRSI